MAQCFYRGNITKAQTIAMIVVSFGLPLKKLHTLRSVKMLQGSNIAFLKLHMKFVHFLCKC